MGREGGQERSATFYTNIKTKHFCAASESVKVAASRP